MVDGALVLLDLNQDFELENSWAHMTVIRREKLGDTYANASEYVGEYIPVTNRGYMWQDSLGNIYIAGGHFFSQPLPGIWGYWQTSVFYRDKEEIPDYSVWKYDIRINKWTKMIPGLAPKYPPLRRLTSSGYISIPSMNSSYCFGYV